VLALILTSWLISQVASGPNASVAISVSAAHSNSLTAGQTPEIPRGQIVERVICLNDRNQSYALYLPSAYTPDRKWPILYAFDPRARGKVPLERFKEAAEQYQWIVVGSNNSRNGPLQLAVEAWNSIVKDTHERFAVDDERVYAAGFSGAARAAIYLATRCRDCIAGVIACGAGFPAGITPSPALHFAVFSVAGVEDFNFPEVRDLDDALARAGMTHRIEVFDGRHEWPPSAVAIEAVEWLELTAMKAGKRARDDRLIAAIRQKTLERASELAAAKKLYDAYQVYAGAAATFRGLSDAGDIEQKVSQLRDSQEVKEAVRNERQQIKKQREIEARIGTLIAGSERGPALESTGEQERSQETGNDGRDPETELQTTLGNLRKQSKGVEDSSDRRIARRVLEGIFISLYEQGLDFLQARKLYARAARTFTLATEVYPERAGSFFYLAWAYAANGDKKRTLQALKSAVEKGYSDLAAIIENKAFDGIRDEVQYRQIIQTLQNKR
jgi:predicted esterase/TolA-binding protein